MSQEYVARASYEIIARILCDHFERPSLEYFARGFVKVVS